MPNDELDPSIPSDVVQPCCLRCGKTLRSAKSRWRGYGSECWTAILAATRSPELRGSDWTHKQLANAIELMRDRGIVLWRQTSRNLVYRSVASNGTTHYLTTIQACNCTAGLWGNACYHRLAVMILQLSVKTARSKNRLYRKEVVK